MCKKSISLFLGVFVWGLVVGDAGAQSLQQDPGPDGIVCVEAENYDLYTERTNTWVLIDEVANGFAPPDGFSGGFALQSTPTGLGQGGGITSNIEEASPQLDYEINFTKTGTYYIWVLAYGMDGNSDSFHAGLDGVVAVETAPVITGFSGDYGWHSELMSNSERPRIEVTTAGLHTFSIWMRETGSTIDKILLTTNLDFTPTDFGPPESTRGARLTASGASPADSAIDIPRDVVLSWTPGESTVARDVYFAAVFDDVNSASRGNPLGVLVSQGQDANTYDPEGVLQFGQTYYWRIDEVNAAPDSTLFRGNVWSFTVEPLAYPITSITATASSAMEGAGPENTINGSGLDADDLHSTDIATMWASTMEGEQPTWIKYEFDRVYKLYELWVWNYNVQFEMVLGYGFKDVTVEYSENGTDWTVLADVEFAKAPSTAGYAHNTTLDLGGVAAKYVKLTANDNWGDLSQYGLSEVRFSFIPANPREPLPASGAQDVSVDTALRWRAGREAVSHEVHFGTDWAAVADDAALVDITGDSNYNLDGLDFGKTYYWKIVEVNEAEAIAAWEGDIWGFSTQEFVVVEDFERYDDEVNRIYDTWIDGYDMPENGSQVGYLEGPFAETTIVNGGRQSMPLYYSSADGAAISEAQRTFASAQDWGAHGADTMVVHFRGNPVDFLERADGSVVIGAAGTDIANTSDEFRYVYKRLNGDAEIIVRVDSLIERDPWTKAGVMIRESLDAGAKFAGVFITPGNGCRFQARQVSNAQHISDTSVATDEQKAITAPYWVKLTRTDNEFNGYYSADGQTWTPMVWNPQSIAMIGEVYIGLAVTSHSAGNPTSAEFSGATTTGGVSGSWDVATVGVEQPSNDPDQLYVMVEDSAGHTGVVAHSDPEATVKSDWQTWAISLNAFSGVNLAAVKSMSIGVGDQDNPQPNSTGLLFVDDIWVGHPGLVDPGAAGLAAQYALENGVEDSSGNGHDGAAVGAPVYVDGPAGAGMALEFDGTGDQYVVLGTFDPAGAGGQLSVSLWARWNGLNDAYQGLIAKRDAWAADDMMWHLEAHQTSGVVRVGRQGISQIEGDLLTAGEWEHWAFTFDGAQVILYHDGEQVASGPFSYGFDAQASLQIGAGSGTGGNPYNGALDEIRLYNRALSSFEVRHLAGW